MDNEQLKHLDAMHASPSSYHYESEFACSCLSAYFADAR
jgi:hypothetical protein